LELVYWWDPASEMSPGVGVEIGGGPVST